MNGSLIHLAGAIARPRHKRDHMTRDERRWFRVHESHRGAFGNPEAARIATLAVFDFDVKAEAGLGPTGSRP